MSDSAENDVVEDSEGIITFDDTLDITMAANYFEKLTDMLNQHKSIMLNGGDVDRIDGAGLQLLVAFFKAAESLHVTVKWQACSDILKNSAKISGLSGSLALD
ncbi:STAS domain-containing protein [sulfur-oxidizing endosymbiont of Gigantopelta aegis]|uniref:STAS domain-containing protein n=1 Tax=sulfur-oxidizing endosymbiont of Gigantopelta aegis TaxID=2794934 RepID=UPI0018DE9BA8|nr:STAS domain-containing protein [sulfur-oxidizing endosymbiont of Gigantopelta aegis]